MASRRRQYHQVAAWQQTNSWTLKQRGEKPASTSTTYLELLPYATAQAKPEVLRYEINYDIMTMMCCDAIIMMTMQQHMHRNTASHNMLTQNNHACRCAPDFPGKQLDSTQQRQEEASVEPRHVHAPHRQSFKER